MQRKYLILLAVLALALAWIGNDLSLGARPRPKPPAGYTRLIFDDEFNRSQLDSAKWQSNWMASDPRALTPPVSVNEHNCYDPADVTESHGALTLAVYARPCAVQHRRYPYRSAIVESNRRFNFTHGYMEARMWLPAGTGMWPAFWSDGQTWPHDGEIDVIEGDGSDSPTFHYRYFRGIYGGTASLPGATTGWHTYAAAWTRSQIRWYYDGRQVGRTRTKTHAPMYLIINLGTRAYPSAVPNRLRVDWVRVWQ